MFPEMHFLDSWIFQGTSIRLFYLNPISCRLLLVRWSYGGGGGKNYLKLDFKS